ncbi:MAG: methylmalonyl-CoA mutase family protein [Cloacibacillus sp.]
MNETEARTDAFQPVSFDEFAEPSHEEWRKEAEAALKGAPFDKRMYTSTYEGITLDPIYTLDGSADLLQNESLPGDAPYLRGTKSSGYVGAPWGIAQSVSESSPAAANAAVAHELAKGATILHFKLDEKSLAGSDPDHSDRSEGGVSISTLEDMDELLKGLDLTKRPVHLYAGSSAMTLLPLVAAQFRASGRQLSFQQVKGCIGADPLGALAECGALAIPLEELYDEMAHCVKWAEKEAPSLKTILIRGSVWHNGGASATQEAAYAVCSAIAYIRALRSRGIEPEAAMKQMKFSLSLGKDFFMEIAKLRAIRVVWAQVAEAFGCGSSECAKIDIIAETSSFTMSKYDPYVNVLRTTTEAFSGAVGGVADMAVGCFDEAVRPAGENSKRIARNIQIMLQTEFEMLQPVDPAGGSWYVERLTAQCAQTIWALVQKIEADGGLYASLEKGLVQEDIDKVFKSRLKNLALRKDRAVGTNMYPNATEKPLETDGADPASARALRAAAVANFKKLRDDEHLADVTRQLAAKLAEGGDDVVPAVVEAYMAGASAGEIRKILDDGFDGRPEAVRPVAPHRQTEEIEALRLATEDYAARTGKNIRIFLANMGPIPQHKGRADFTTGFMEVANFEVIKNTGFASPEEAAAAAVASGADAAVICSTDDTYPELVPPTARCIKAAAPQMKVLLAGAPAAEFKDSYVEAGVDDFIHVKANCLQILKSIQESKAGFKNAQ